MVIALCHNIPVQSTSWFPCWYLWITEDQGHSHTKVCQLQQDTALIWKNLNINLYTEWIVYIWFGHVASSTQWNSPETELLSNLGYIYHCLLAIRVIESCENLMKLIYFPFNFCIHSLTTSSITHSIFSSAYLHWNCIKIRLFLVVLINLVSTCVMGVWWSVLSNAWSWNIPGELSQYHDGWYHVSAITRPSAISPLRNTQILVCFRVYFSVLKIRTICHAWDLWNLAWSCKQLHLLCPPDTWNLPGTALLSGLQNSWRAVKSTE